MSKELQYRILFVDDDVAVLRGLQRNFSDIYDVETAESGEEALKIISENEGAFAVIVSDYQMPSMNGVEFFEKVAEIDPQPVRIMLTGKADLTTVMNALNRGNIYRFLIKPVDNSDLSQKLEEAICKYVELSEMQIKSVTDSLTGLLNHGVIMERLAEELQRNLRYGTMFSAAMVDIDFFKDINDTHGHPVGDVVLKKLSMLIKDTIRTVDLAGRYGGEEFLILMPGIDLEGAYTVLERIRKKVAKKKWNSVGVTFTISAGVTQADSESAESFIKRVDDLLYMAKRNGRNRVEK